VVDRTATTPLTPKEEQFCAEYLVDRNGAQAAIRAGYAKKSAKVTASRLLTKANVKAHLAGLSSEVKKKTLVDAEYVIGGIKEVVERCMQRVPVMVTIGTHRVQLQNEDGQGVWTFDAAGANRGLENLGKHLKLFTDRLEVEIIDNLAERLKAARLRRANG